MSNCRYFFFYCYGDHRDLHVRTRSFPTRRSSDLSARTTRHITAVQKTAVCCTPPAAAAKLAFYAVELSNNPCEKQRSENPYRRLNVEHSCYSPPQPCRHTPDRICARIPGRPEPRSTTRRAARHGMRADLSGARIRQTSRSQRKRQREGKR